MTRRRDDQADLPWADGYPMDGDVRACSAYLGQVQGGSSPFGYYQVVSDGAVVGGIGFHGPPADGLVEVGYGVVPAVRGRGIATAALGMLLDEVATIGGVQRVKGRTEEHNLASRRVMTANGMRLVDRDDEFLHFEIDLRSPA